MNKCESSPYHFTWSLKIVTECNSFTSNIDTVPTALQDGVQWGSERVSSYVYTLLILILMCILVFIGVRAHEEVTDYKHSVAWSVTCHHGIKNKIYNKQIN